MKIGKYRNGKLDSSNKASALCAETGNVAPALC